MVSRTIGFFFAFLILSTCATPKSALQQRNTALTCQVSRSSHKGAELANLETNRKATVKIDTKGGHGTGVVLNAEGFVLTAYHVIQDEHEIKVIIPQFQRDAAVFPAHVVATLERADLAVLKIDAKLTHWVTLGDPDALFIGDEIYTDSYPFTLGPVISRGYLSSKKHLLTIAHISNLNVFLGHIDEAPGSSGSGIFSVRDGTLHGILVLYIEYIDQATERTLTNEVFVPVETIKSFLIKKGICYSSSLSSHE